MRSLIRRAKTIIRNPQNALMLINHRIGSISGRFFAPMLRYRAFLPEAVNLYPTDRCNLKCSMCFEKLRDPRPERTPGEWLGIIDRLACFKPRIHLSGGEPLLYHGVDDLIARLKRHGLYVAITTNGTFLDRYADVIVNKGVNAITVSIDGPGDIHDTVRGVPGTFDRMLRGLDSLGRYRRHTGFPALRINSMINPENPGAMQEVIRIAVTYGAEIVQFLHPMYASEQDLAAHRHFLSTRLNLCLNYWQGAQEVAQQNPDIPRIQEVCRDLQREHAVHVEIFPAFTQEQMHHYYTMDPRFYTTVRGQCRAMWSTATILPSGDVESCPDYLVGNCTTTPFKHLWNSEPMRALRKRIRQRRFFTVCRACCFYYM